MKKLAVWLVLCSTGELHPQQFQAGRAPFGAYKSRWSARRAASAANRWHPGHRVVKFESEDA